MRKDRKMPAFLVPFALPLMILFWLVGWVGYVLGDRVVAVAFRKPKSVSVVRCVKYLSCGSANYSGKCMDDLEAKLYCMLRNRETKSVEASI